MEYIYNCLFEFKDYLGLVLGFLLSVCWTIILYRLKPNLSIESVDLNDKELNIKVVNKGIFHAVNLKVEACVIKNSYTYHLNIDKQDFIILPSKKRKQKNDISYYRIFKIDDLSESASKYTSYEGLITNLTNEKSKHLLRIRIHANHEYSGFGKAFESQFKFEKERFVKIE